MNIVEATKKWYKNWANYKGFSEREEYWLGLMGAFILMFIFNVIAAFSRGIAAEAPTPPIKTFNAIILMLYFLFAMVNFFAVLSGTSRRLRDVNKSDWYLLLLLFPIIGYIVLIVLLIGPSVIENNKYRNNE